MVTLPVSLARGRGLHGSLFYKKSIETFSDLGVSESLEKLICQLYGYKTVSSVD